MSASKLESGFHTSHLLRQFLAQHAEQEHVCLQDLLDKLGKRAYGPTLLICALPEALPLPIAGVSAIIGIPLMLISAQLCLGFARPRLPKWIGQHPVKRVKLEKIVFRGLGYLEKIERWVRPRWGFITNPVVERLLGFLLFLLAVVIALPIPLGNMLPAIAIFTISIGMIEKDGVAIVLGVVAAGVILTVMAGAIAALFSVTLNFLNNT